MAGFGFTYGAISLNTRIQLTVPLAVRGRVLALISMTGLGAMPVGSLLVASVADTFGTQLAVATGAVTTFLHGVAQAAASNCHCRARVICRSPNSA